MAFLTGTNTHHLCFSLHARCILKQSTSPSPRWHCILLREHLHHPTANQRLDLGFITKSFVCVFVCVRAQWFAVWVRALFVCFFLLHCLLSGVTGFSLLPEDHLSWTPSVTPSPLSCTSSIRQHAALNDSG